MKNVGYDDDEYEDDEGYESPDPEEQEFLKQCTALVSQQLRAGQPSVTATTEEIQEALWHYYNDIEKSTNYLRGTLRRNVCRQDCAQGLGVSFLAWWAAAYPCILSRQEGKGAKEAADGNCAKEKW